MPSYFKSLEHLLRYCARPPFALERLSVRCGEDGRINRVHYVLPRHKAANWGGSGRGRKTTRPGAPVSPARGPPTDWGELVQVNDDRAIFQASPDELPVIDIRSL